MSGDEVYSRCADANYEEQTKAYTEAIKPIKDSGSGLVRYNASTTKCASHKIDKPLPPNQLIAYPPSVFGLDQAQRDRRFEMLRIVREVEAVTENPQVAFDPTRNNQFLSSVIFRQLLPSAEKLDPVAIKKKINELETKLTAGQHTVITLESEKELLSTKVSAIETDLKTMSEGRDSLKTRPRTAANRNETLSVQLEDSEANPDPHISGRGA